MKRLVAVMTMAVLVLTGGIVLGMLTESNGDTTPQVQAEGQARVMQCAVIEEDGNVKVLEDECNNLWLLNARELCVGDELCVWLDDVNTPKDLTDDVILNYCEVMTD